MTDLSDLISERIRAGERPSVVLRHLAGPDQSPNRLGGQTAAAFPEADSAIVHVVWGWRSRDRSDLWDEYFDFQLIRALLARGVDLPWTAEQCQGELDQLGAKVAEVVAAERKAATEAMSFDNLRERIAKIPGRVACIEALWDGDTQGWFICLSVVVESASRFVTEQLGAISYGGDIRLFNCAVPPWPEAQHAADVGRRLAQYFGAEFYFPSPDKPDDRWPSWCDVSRKSGR